MRVAMIGLGDIARKAYLPVLGTRRDIELCLMSRNAVTVAEVAADWRVPQQYTDLDLLLRDGLDAAFVHAATAAHEEIATRLLKAGVHTYVDKPLADTAAGAERLVALAEEKNVSLMAGFNRRFAPDYAALAGAPRDLIVMQKHRVSQADTPRAVIFDDFIHVIDTLRFLLPGPPRETRLEFHPSAGLLHHVALTLTSQRGDAACTAIGIMNRVAGVNEETLEVSGTAGDGQTVRHRVGNLADVWISRGGTENRTARGDWTPVATQRGIQQACDHFLSAVREGRRLCAQDALDTHRICEDVVARIEADRR